jgi:hypothetical protein
MPKKLPLEHVNQQERRQAHLMQNRVVSFAQIAVPIPNGVLLILHNSKYQPWRHIIQGINQGREAGVTNIAVGGLYLFSMYLPRLDVKIAV